MEAIGDERDPAATTVHTWLSAAEEKLGDPASLLWDHRASMHLPQTEEQL